MNLHYITNNAYDLIAYTDGRGKVIGTCNVSQRKGLLQEFIAALKDEEMWYAFVDNCPWNVYPDVTLEDLGEELTDVESISARAHVI